MEIISDQFISYDEEFMVKQESDREVSLNFQPESSYLPLPISNSYPEFISPKLKHILDSSDLTLREPLVMNYSLVAEVNPLKRKKPFKIIRSNGDKPKDTFEVKLEPEKKVFNNSKKDFRREVSKKKIIPKKEESDFLTAFDRKLLTEDINSLNLDEKTRKKMLQMIRNRISAQNSRDRRKTYVQTLEYTKELLAKENNRVSEDNKKLLLQLNKLKDNNAKIFDENKSLMIQNVSANLSLNEDFGQTNDDTIMTRIKYNIDKFTEGAPCSMSLICPELPRNMVNFSLLLGFMLAIIVVTRLNQPEMTNSDGLDGAESTKVDCINDKAEVSSMGWEETNDCIRKMSHSTTYSSHGSPHLEGHVPCEKLEKLIFWDQSLNDGVMMDDVSDLRQKFKIREHRVKAYTNTNNEDLVAKFSLTNFKETSGSELI